MYIISCLFQVRSHGINYAYDLNCLLAGSFPELGSAARQNTTIWADLLVTYS